MQPAVETKRQAVGPTRSGVRSLAVAFVILVPAWLGPLATAGPRPGDPAPDFALRGLHGGNLRLSGFRGDVVMISFWATWCGPCQQQMRELERISDTYGNAGLVMLGINLDEDRARAESMAARLGVRFPLLFDERKDVSRLYDLGSIPFTFLVDREGVVSAVHEGFQAGQERIYLDAVRSLLGE